MYTSKEMNNILNQSISVTFDRTKRLFFEKNKTNGSAWIQFGLIGRFFDIYRKFARIQEIFTGDTSEYIDLEKLKDETQDLVVYSIMLDTMVNMFCPDYKSVCTREEFESLVKLFNNHIENGKMFEWKEQINKVFIKKEEAKWK